MIVGYQPAIDDYDRALRLLREALAFGIEPSLDGIRALTRQLGQPQLAYPSIQIAGTNGKSSTARFTAAFLHSQGYRVGLYTSPELVAYPERIEINGEVISEQRFAQAVLAAHAAAESVTAAGEVQLVTEFELLTAAALWLYREEQVDFAVLEVGLGGRWDATSVVAPTVAAITGIDLDHTAILGDTIQQIAAEKAAIIRPGSTAVLGFGIPDDCREVFAEAMAAAGGGGALPQEDIEPYWELLQGLDSSRFPRYQQQNIACALAVAAAALGKAGLRPDAAAGSGHQVPGAAPVHQAPSSAAAPGHQAPGHQSTVGCLMDLKSIQGVLDDLRIPGRFELLREQPPLMIDASHNPQSAQVLATALVERYGLNQDGRLNCFDSLLLGILADKDAAGIIAALAPLFENLMVTQSQSPRAIPAAELAQLVRQVDGRQPQLFSSVAEALAALTAAGAATVATGSITLAGEVAACLRPDTTYAPHAVQI